MLTFTFSDIILDFTLISEQKIKIVKSHSIYLVTYSWIHSCNATEPSIILTITVLQQLADEPVIVQAAPFSHSRLAAPGTWSCQIHCLFSLKYLKLYVICCCVSRVYNYLRKEPKTTPPPLFHIKHSPIQLYFLFRDLKVQKWNLD